jgi:Tfp pilus assembly protein PilF
MMKLLSATAVTALLLAATAAAQAPVRSRSGGMSRPSAPAPVPASTRAISSPGAVSGPSQSRSYGSSYGSYGGGYGRSMFTPRAFRRNGPNYFSGSVAVDGGGSFSNPVRLRCNCAGDAWDLGYASYGGRFSFPMGRRGFTFGGPFGGAYDSCSLLFTSPGFVPFFLPLGSIQPSGLGYAGIGKIRMQPREDFSGTTVSITSLTAPKEAQKLYRKGSKALLGEKPDPAEAIEYLEQAVQLHPNYAAAWTMLGRARATAQDPPGARVAFERAIEADPKYVAPYSSLTKLVVNQKEWPYAVDLAGKALALNPFDAEIKFLYALAAFETEDYTTAELYATRIYQTDDLAYYPNTLILLARIHAKMGRPAQAARIYQEFLDTGAQSSLKRVARGELAQALAAVGTATGDNAP